MMVYMKNKKAPDEPYISMDLFLKTAAPMYDMTSYQVTGFKTLMRSKGKVFAKGYEPFLEELKKYIKR